MLSTHTEPFAAFCKDLQIPGCEVHLYRGPNTFGTLLGVTGPLPDWWETENVYFLAGVKIGLKKRAADIDVLQRGMFTLDFDIKKELEKAGKDIWKDTVEEMGDKILCSLEHHPMWGKFRYVVMSGNGMHVHYFGPPVAVQKELWVTGMKNIFTEVAKITPIPPDFGCGNAGRIMRMPGSWNVKDPANKKKVDFIVWMPTYTLPDLSFVQERGMIELERYGQIQEAKKQEFIESGGRESNLIELINSIPVEQVIAQLFAGMRVKQVKKDGGMRFADDKGIERGFFKHHEYNIIVHEGTALFPPPAGKGYNPLGLVKAVKGLSAHDAIQWFCERSGKVREAREADRRQWMEEHNSQHIFEVEETASRIDA